jgi:hypothetical protein
MLGAMNDIGSVRFSPPPQFPSRTAVPRDAAAATVKAPSMEPRAPVEAPDSALYTPAAAKKHRVSAQIANTIHYAAQAARATTGAVLETGSRLNVRV